MLSSTFRQVYHAQDNHPGNSLGSCASGLKELALYLITQGPYSICSEKAEYGDRNN